MDNLDDCPFCAFSVMDDYCEISNSSWEVSMKRMFGKKIIMLIVCGIFALALAGCAKSTETDYVAAIMVDGEIY